MNTQAKLVLDTIARITFTDAQVATLVGINRGAVKEDQLSDKDAITICGIVSESLVKLHAYDFNSICTQIWGVVNDGSEKKSQTMAMRIRRGVSMALVMFHLPVYKITKETRTLSDGKSQKFDTFKRPNYLNFDNGEGEMTITDAAGKSSKVLAKGHAEGEKMVSVHADTVNTVLRELKDDKGTLLYPPKNKGGKKKSPDPDLGLPEARTFRVECTAIRTVLQTVHTGTKVIGPDAGDVSIDDIDAAYAIIEMWDLLNEKLTRDQGSDWRKILRAAIKS
jgi:hypothetical protein